MFKNWIIAAVVFSLFPFLSLSSAQAQSWQERLRELYRRDEQKKRDNQMEQWQRDQRQDREAALERENRGKRQHEAEERNKKTSADDSSASASSGPANWTGKWTVKPKSGNEMTLELKQDGGRFTGEWSSAIAHGKITLSAEGEGTMTHSLLGKCQIKLVMANTENSFFKGEYSCTQRHHDPVYASVKGTKKKSWW